MITALRDIDLTVGKTIKKAYHEDDVIVITFTDNTCICLNSEGDEDYDVTTHIELTPLYLLSYLRRVALDLELSTVDEYDEQYNAVQKRKEEENKKERQRQYEALKKEFES